MSLYIVDIHGELEGDYEIIKKYEEPTIKNNLGVDCIDRAELLKAIDTWDKFGCDADMRGRGMTRDQFIYALTACGCLLKYDKTWYEHNELIKCFEDLGLFDEQETKDCSDCEIIQACVEASIKSISRVLYEKDEALDMIKEEIGCLRTFNPYTVAFQQDVLNVIDKYKTESEGNT